MIRVDGMALDVVVRRSGQERAYADSKYEYDVEVVEGADEESAVRDAMQKAFRLPKQRKEDWAWEPMERYFAGWLDVQRVGERKWKVSALRPYAD